jgi:restriction system-associated AAA family ATPase
MKLIRLKITDPAGFRSLPYGFEHHFRTEWSLQDELTRPDGFAPFVCAGRNGSGKSNLLEALAAIFFQLEIQRARRSFLPEVLQDEDQDFSPLAFELDYLIRVPSEYVSPGGLVWAKVGVWKKAGESVRFIWENQGDFETEINESFKGGYADIILPQYVLGYSSGENEILSLPFFKMRFIQFDEYFNALKKQLPYPGRPETRLAYLDSSFSQAILLCNLLFQDDATLQPFREDVGVKALREFRIIIRRSIPLEIAELEAFASENESERQSLDEILKNNPALQEDTDEFDVKRYRLNLLQLLEGGEKSSMLVNALKRCATLHYEDEATDSLVLDYWVNDTTKQAFRENFDGSPLTLFQALQVLLTLNLYTVSDALKSDLYTSTSQYINETIPTLASDERIMRFKNLYFMKEGVQQPMLLKELSDGEHQLLHSLGLCLLFTGTNCLVLLDEPETHFNPDWRANFISRLRECLPSNDEYAQEMLITTHTPFLISDSKPDKVLVFEKDNATGAVSISNPDYKTLGASINKITMKTFGKGETIGAYAQGILNDLRKRFEQGDEDSEVLINEIHQKLGDSVEKLLLIKAILASEEAGSTEADS